MLKRYAKISTILILFFSSFFLFSKQIIASDCSEVYEDYHTFRPYPGDPCYEEYTNLSLLCGNDMKIIKKFSRVPSQGICQNIDSNNYFCTFSDSGHIKVEVDTSQSKLPIMGNTELVTNRDNAEDQIDDTTKVNDFVSWYLNGAVNYAENPHPIDDLASAIEEWWTGYYKNVINYSGPLRKLLPQDIQSIYRIEQVERAIDSSSKSDVHDQVVGCTYGLNTPIKDIENVINTLLQVLGQDKINIPGSTVGNIVGPCHINLNVFNILNISLDGLKTEHRLSEWNENFPPIMESGQDPREWWIKYEEWRGKFCLVIPGWKIIPNFLKYQGICIESPLEPNYYADLFTNIPMSSMEDKVGNLVINEPSKINSEDIDVKIENFKLVNAATLYFPHMKEISELSVKLQNTYVPQEGTNNNPGYSETVDTSNDCTILQIRSGDTPGDSLYGNTALAEFDYEASFTCNFSKSDSNPSCSKTMTLTSKINTNIPLADEVWNNLVNGNSAVVRRMFPKLGVDGLGTLIDLPTVTTANYSAQGADAIPDTAEIYFPHIGAVDEYFLKGIQTLLRPKGYGESISFGEPIDYDPGTCDFDSSKIESAIQNAASKYGVPASMLKAIYEIEALPYIANPSSYRCKENGVGAAGIMGITKSAYNVVTCESERIENDIAVCGKTQGKLSRCNIEDTFELAARIVLWKAGKWQYGPGTCSATGGISTPSKMEVYNAAWKYYGSYLPDELTKQYSYNLLGEKRSDPPGMNYADIVCNKMGLCPPYPVQ